MKNAANKFSLNCLIIIIFSTRTNFNKLKCHLRWPQQQYQLLNSGCSSISWASSAYEWWWSLFVQKLYDVKIQTCAQNLQFLFANSVFIFSIRFAFSSFIFAVAIWFSCKLKCNIFSVLSSLAQQNEWIQRCFKYVCNEQNDAQSHCRWCEWDKIWKKKSKDISIYPFRIQFQTAKWQILVWSIGWLDGWMVGWLSLMIMIHVYTFLTKCHHICNRIGLMYDRQMI